MLIALTLTLATPLPVDAARTQSPEPPGVSTTPVSLIVGSVTPWVGQGGTWVASFQVTNAPVGAVVTAEVEQPFEGSEATVRRSVRASIDGTSEVHPFHRPLVFPLAAITAADGSSSVNIGLREGADDGTGRLRFPRSGVFPVRLRVNDAQGRTLSSATVYLNRVPSDSDHPPGRLAILIQPLPTTAPSEADEPGSVTEPTRDRYGGLAALLETARGLTVNVAPNPVELDALARSTSVGDAQLVRRLRASMASARLVRTPTAPIDLESWASTGASTVVEAVLGQGASTVQRLLDRPLDRRVWPTDPTIGPASVELLRRLGVSGVVIGSDRLSSSRAPTGESGLTRPFVLRSRGQSVKAMPVDPDLEALLTAATDQPGLAANQAVALMVATWLADKSSRGFVVPVTEPAEAPGLSALLESLRARADRTDADDPEPPLSLSTLPELLELSPMTTRVSGKSSPWTRSPAERELPRDQGSLSLRFLNARHLVDELTAMAGSSDPAVVRHSSVLWRSVDRDLDAGDANRSLAHLATVILGEFAELTSPRPAPLRVTSRNPTIPLRFVNGSTRPLTVRLRLRSPRLQFLGGADRRIVLQPGINVVKVRTKVRASGDFVLQADLLTPVGDRVLVATRRQVRSTAFSGVGVALSIGALVFLLVWWGRTLRSRR
ncbi:MAG: hypothetical protein R2698_04930 [Microthrixaceae bacterium]